MLALLDGMNIPDLCCNLQAERKKKHILWLKEVMVERNNFKIVVWCEDSQKLV